MGISCSSGTDQGTCTSSGSTASAPQPTLLVSTGASQSWLLYYPYHRATSMMHPRVCSICFSELSHISSLLIIPLAMTRDSAQFGQHCWSATAHPPWSSTFQLHLPTPTAPTAGLLINPFTPRVYFIFSTLTPGGLRVKQKSHVKVFFGNSPKFGFLSNLFNFQSPIRERIEFY